MKIEVYPENNVEEKNQERNSCDLRCATPVAGTTPPVLCILNQNIHGKHRKASKKVKTKQNVALQN